MMNLILNTISRTSTDQLINLILVIASVITALTVIVHFIKKSNDTVSVRIRTEAKEVATQEVLMERALREQNLSKLEERLSNRFNSLEDKLDKLIEHNVQQTEQQDRTNYLLQQGHIETWKNDIRTVYYNLRDSGSISDAEKSYVDKIYHLYKEMGGNSDIDAKYNEMVSVYKKRLSEVYDEAYKNKKVTKSTRARQKVVEVVEEGE